MKIVGIDYSQTSAGIAAFNSAAAIPLTTGAVGEGGHRDDTLVMRHARIRRQTARVATFCIGADVALIEAHSFSAKGGSQHDRSGGWWHLVDTLYGWGIPVVEVSTTQVKKYMTGKGNASKEAMVIAATRRYTDVEITTSDEADALSILSIGARHFGHPLEEGEPTVPMLAVMKSMERAFAGIRL
jgi:crossover junction endodeoxyribonuclease RuvC